MRNKFNTSIEAEILKSFKEKCREDGLPISIVLEKFMEGYVKGEFTFKMKYSGEDGK